MRRFIIVFALSWSVAHAVLLSARWLPPVVSQPAIATSAVYVYEKDDGAVPPAVAAGLNRLNREKKLFAVAVEDDDLDGKDRELSVYRTQIEAARKVGLPALVVMAGDKVLRVVQAPKTDAEVVEAAP